MIIIRVLRDIKTHFPVRRSEWVSSFVMIGWGFIIWIKDNPGPSWSSLPDGAEQILILLGIFRVCALIINGTFAHSWYSRWSPHVRVLLSTISALLYFYLVVTLLRAPELTTGLAPYLGYFALDAMNAWSAAGDASEMDRNKRNAKLAAGTDQGSR